MKRGLTIFVNVAVIAFIIAFIVDYTSQKRTESNDFELTAFQNTAETAGQIIANYLADEQHLCDIWASYINHYTSEEGYHMTIEEAIEFTRRASISDMVEANIVYYDDGSFSGLSSAHSLKEENDYTVSYKGYSLFSNFSESNLNNEVRQTAAFANLQNGVPSMAFLNTLTLRGDNPGETRKALLMRIIPISEISRKLVYLKGEYKDVELAIIDTAGNYMIHGSQLKNSNFFEYYKSYNHTDYLSQREFEEAVTGKTGLLEIIDYKGQKCVVAHTPVTTDNDWFLINIIPESSLIPIVVDWVLLGGVIGTLVFLLIFNMASMMYFNRRLAIAAKEAEKANAAKSNFLSMMSHDIRTPMNAITGFNEMISRESSDPDILRYSEGIRMADKTLLSLINDILDFSKLEAGKLDIIPVEYDLVSILNDLVNMIQVRTEEKNLALEIHIDPMIPRKLYGDELRIKQCVINLLSNAVKYTTTGTVTFTVGYEGCEDEEDQILLKMSVADTGLGIKQEDIDRLFVAFQRLEEKRNRNIEGTGLGLNITQSLLNRMGSSLKVESEYGKGSVFSFAVKQEVRGTDAVGEYEEAFRSAMESRGGYKRSFTAPAARLLVVDDTPLNLSVFTSLLKATKVSVDTAESGSECLRKCTQNKYDVVFLDHMMPEMDGIQTLHALKELEDNKNADTPVICLTANAISGMREMFLSEGFTDYLTKPIDYVMLEQMLLKYIPEEKITEESTEETGESRKLPEAVYKIPNLDADSGLSYCGDVDTYLKSLKLYGEAAEKNAEEIRNFWKVRDIKNLTIKIHALKSTSKVIGAFDLGELAAGLEQDGRLGRLEEFGDGLERFLFMYNELALKLTEMFKSIGVGQQPSEIWQAERLQADEKGEGPEATEHKQLLLVDDDPLYLKMVRGWLTDKYEVAAVKAGSQALSYLKGHRPDLILLDFEMKDMDGPEVLKAIRENPETADIPVVFLTGRTDEEAIESVMSQKPAGYLLKTMDRDSIVKAIDGLWGQGILSK